MREEKQSLMMQFEQVYAMLHRFQGFLFQSRGPVGTPHRGQGRVLAILKMQPEISQKELGYLLDMRNQSLGELLGKLEKKGYITRTPSKADRRTMNIKLTQAGAEAAGQAEQKQDEADQLFSCLNPEQKQQLTDILDQLEEGLEKQFMELIQQYQGRDGRMWGNPLRAPGRMPPPSPPHHGGHHRGCSGDERDPRFFDYFRGGSPFAPRDRRHPYDNDAAWDPDDNGDDDED